MPEFFGCPAILSFIFWGLTYFTARSVPKHQIWIPVMTGAVAVLFAALSSTDLLFAGFVFFMVFVMTIPGGRLDKWHRRKLNEWMDKKDEELRKRFE